MAHTALCTGSAVLAARGVEATGEALLSVLAPLPRELLSVINDAPEVVVLDATPPSAFLVPLLAAPTTTRGCGSYTPLLKPLSTACSRAQTTAALPTANSARMPGRWSDSQLWLLRNRATQIFARGGRNNRKPRARTAVRR